MNMLKTRNTPYLSILSRVEKSEKWTHLIPFNIRIEAELPLVDNSDIENQLYSEFTCRVKSTI